MKKMRRMIPALCMLLVSAIMLSTASYAWFTMNEQVEATGMQVQAQAGGAMIIGTELLTESDQSWTADFATTSGNKKISPMTRLDGGWKVPADPELVDGTSGHYKGEDWDAAGTTGSLRAGCYGHHGCSQHSDGIQRQCLRHLPGQHGT